jgi:hypothetical protein
MALMKLSGEIMLKQPDDASDLRRVCAVLEEVMNVVWH